MNSSPIPEGRTYGRRRRPNMRVVFISGIPECNMYRLGPKKFIFATRLLGFYVYEMIYTFCEFWYLLQGVEGRKADLRLFRKFMEKGIRHCQTMQLCMYLHCTKIQISPLLFILIDIEGYPISKFKEKRQKDSTFPCIDLLMDRQNKKHPSVLI